MSSIENISTGYVPRKWQIWAHNNFKRHNCVVFHRRGGKSLMGINEIIDKSIKFDKMDYLTGQPLRDPQYAFCSLTVANVKQVAWNYMKYYTRNIPGVKYDNRDLICWYPHPRGEARLMLFGMENYNAKRGFYLDGFVSDEHADMHPDARNKVLLPTISDRLGWELIIGTPKGANAFKDLYYSTLGDPDWFTCLFKASMTGIISDSELRMLRRTMTAEAYAQEYECDFNVAPEGKYYQKMIQEAKNDKRICKVPYDPNYLVNTYWDLGFSDTCAIWFIQEAGREPHAINYMEFNGKGMNEIGRELLQEKYMYGEHIIPHDGKQVELGSGRTRSSYLLEAGLRNIRTVPKIRNDAEGVHNIRQVLPMMWFDEEHCANGIRALEHYERAFDAKEKVFKDKAKHNWASHPTKAFETFACDYRPGFGGLSYGISLDHKQKAGYNVYNH